jgi:mannose-6-phosphate isomerase-like protein (cupin superfamily)
MLRDNLAGLIEPMRAARELDPLALFTKQKKSSDDRRQHALKIPALKGRNLTLTENAASPFHAEPRHNGALFIMENRKMVRGGPPRHIHYEQEEWFYFVEGSDEVRMEVGETKLRLKPGDSVLAPRNVPHVWAYLGQQPGRMLFAFTPAARIESFFEETSKPDAKANDPSRFERHGMKLVGPPLLGS